MYYPGCSTCVVFKVGSLTLGDYNKNKCSHTINWHPLRARFGDDLIEEYATRVDAVSYGSHVYFLDEHVIWTAKLDAGHNVVLYAPKKIADDIGTLRRDHRTLARSFIQALRAPRPRSKNAAFVLSSWASLAMIALADTPPPCRPRFHVVTRVSNSVCANLCFG